MFNSAWIGRVDYDEELFDDDIVDDYDEEDNDERNVNENNQNDQYDEWIKTTWPTSYNNRMTYSLKPKTNTKLFSKTKAARYNSYKRS
jgi:hypothetical protein